MINFMMHKSDRDSACESNRKVASYTGRRVRTQRCAIKAGTMTARAPASSLKFYSNNAVNNKKERKQDG